MAFVVRSSPRGNLGSSSVVSDRFSLKCGTNTIAVGQPKKSQGLTIRSYLYCRINHKVSPEAQYHRVTTHMVGMRRYYDFVKVLIYPVCD